MICRMHARQALMVSIVSAAVCGSSAQAQLSKVDRLLQQNGFQLQAAVDPNGSFYLNGLNVSGNQVGGFTQANYTAPSWAGATRFTDSNNVPLTGPWGIWDVNTGDFPDQVSADVPHLSNLLTMQINDEANWQGDTTGNIEANLVSEFQYAQSKAAYNNTILYTNNYLGQIEQNPGVAGGVSGFIQQAKPDMLTFDNYPYQTSNASAADDSLILNTPFDSWYTELRFYRDTTLDNSYQASNPNYGVDFGIYRQTYATDDGTRVPSATEYAVQTFTAMAFNAKYESDFIYNDGASALFTNSGATTPLYNAVQHVNQEAANLGKTMVYLTPLIANPNMNWTDGTPDILMLRGQQVNGNTTTPNTLPNGFQPSSSTNFSAWTQGVNDPWVTGFGQANIGGVNQYVNAAGTTIDAPGDALISWFRPLGQSQAQATSKGDLYFMIVNCLSSPNATPDQCLQNIHMDFSSWPLAPGQSQPSIQYIDPVTGLVMTLDEDQTGMEVTNSTIEPAGTVLLTNTLGDDTNAKGKLRLSVFLDGGDAFLFKFNTGDAFVSVPEPTSAALLLSLAGVTCLRRQRVKR